MKAKTAKKAIKAPAPDFLSRRRIVMKKILDSTRSYIFEVYRLAVDMGVKGFIKKRTATEFEIEIEGDQKAIEAFIDKLETLTEGSATLTTHYIMNNILNYNEFRIINH